MPASPLNQQEQTDRVSDSLAEQHPPSTIPPIPSTSAILLPPRQSVTFNGNTYESLPDHLAAMLATLPPLPAPP
jgi:hypothetical protein